MFRKIAGVFLLCIGGFLLLAAGMTFLMFLMHTVTAIVFIVYSVVGMGFVVGGTALWSCSRWRVVFGVVFTVVGSTLGLVAITFPLMMLSPEWELLGGPKHSAPVTAMIASSALFCVILLSIGIPLIIKEKRRNREATI